jgi:hypothetical protein
MLGLALGYEKPTSKVSRFGILDYQEGYQTLQPWYPCGYLKKNQISDPAPIFIGKYTISLIPRKTTCHNYCTKSRGKVIFS